jgi:hypothetical protein
MNPDGSGFKIVAEGHPMFWSADSGSIYLDGKSLNVEKLDLSTGAIKAIAGLPDSGDLDLDSESRSEGDVPTVLGRLPGQDWFVVASSKTRKLELRSVDFGRATVQEPWNVPLTDQTPRGSAWLRRVQWTPTNNVLLVYKGRGFEQFKVAEGNY